MRNDRQQTGGYVSGRGNGWDKEGIIVHFESFLTYYFNC